MLPKLTSQLDRLQIPDSNRNTRIAPLNTSSDLSYGTSDKIAGSQKNSSPRDNSEPYQSSNVPFIQDLPDELIQLILEKMPMKDKAFLSLFRLSSGLRTNHIIFTHALPIIVDRINGEAISARKASAVFMDYAARIHEMPPTMQLKATAHLGEFLGSDSKIAPAIAALFHTIETQPKPTTPADAILYVRTRLKATQNLPAHQRAAYLKRQIDRLKYHKSNDENMKEKADLIEQCICLSGMIPLAQRPQILKKCCYLLDEVSDETVVELFPAVVQAMERTKMVAENRAEGIRMNQQALKPLKRYLNTVSDAKKVSRMFVRYLALTSSIPHDDMAKAFDDVTLQAAVIKDNRTMCKAVVDAAEILLQRFTNGNHQIELLRSLFIPLESRSMPKDYNARYWLANFVHELPAQLRIAAEWKFLAFLPIMSNDGLSKTSLSLLSRVKDMEDMDMHRDFRATQDAWLAQQRQISRKNIPDVYPE